MPSARASMSCGDAAPRNRRADRALYAFRRTLLGDSLAEIEPKGRVTVTAAARVRLRRRARMDKCVSAAQWPTTVSARGWYPVMGPAAECRPTVRHRPRYQRRFSMERRHCPSQRSLFAARDRELPWRGVGTRLRGAAASDLDKAWSWDGSTIGECARP